MGARGDSGAQGSDAGFENTQKSKLSKKNQKLVDSSFRDRGAEKIKQKATKKTTPLATKVLSGPLQAGSKRTRDFFENKVLGSRNYKGTSKKDFQNLTASQQESMYESYLEGRTSGRTDAYGNPTGRDRDNDSGMTTTAKATAPKQTTALLSTTPASEETQVDEVITETASEAKPQLTEAQRLVNVKRKAKTKTRLRQDDEDVTLGKKVLLAT